MNSHWPKLPFDATPGLPSDDEDEVVELAGILGRLPRDSIERLACCLLRAALAQERSGEVAHLTRLAEDMLTTVRLQTYLATGTQQTRITTQTTPNASD